MNPDLAILVLRVTVGGLAIFLGLLRLSFGLGLRSGRFWALFTITVEALGGLLMVGGLGGPIGPGLVAEVLVVVVIVARVPPGFWDRAAQLGWEFPALRAMSTLSPGSWHMPIAAGALMIAILGNGAWSVDRAVGLMLPDAFRTALLAILGVCVVLVVAVRALVARVIARA